MTLQEFEKKYGKDILFAVPGTRYGYVVNPDWFHLFELVSGYKGQLIRWFDRLRADKENPMSCVTQEHWYSLYLEKKRLEKRELYMHHKEYRLCSTHSKRRGDYRVTHIKYFNDGKYVINKVSQDTKFDIRYVRNNKVVQRIERKCNVDYYILRSTTKNGMYLCPNCGAEMPLEKLLDGCDYCNSKFDISAYNDKVISVARVQGRDDHRSNWGRIDFWLGILGICIFVPIIISALFPPLILLLPVGIGIAAIFMAVKVPALKQEQRIHNEFLKMICLANPGISIEEFIASLDCKIKSVHFAESPEDVAAFVKCDIAPYLQSNQNVVRCESGRFMIKDYRSDDNFQYITLHRSVRVLIDCGDHLEEDVKVLQVSLAKQKVYKHKNDVSMFICNHCGATISLTEGGICKYCGTMMDYDAYDWVIIDYQFAE